MISLKVEMSEFISLMCFTANRFQAVVNFGVIRFRTDASTLQGVEKLSVTMPDSAFLEVKYKSLPQLADCSVVLNMVRAAFRRL